MKLAEGKLLFRKLSLTKVFNAFGVYFSFHLSRLLKRNIRFGFPVTIAVEPTTSCNLRCPECPSGLRSFTRPTGMLEETFFERLIQEIQSKTIYLTFYFQGEPYLNPKFLDMVKTASRSGLFTSTSTNAHYLNDDAAKRTVESGLDRLIISIDGAQQESYEQYRVGGSLSKVIEGTENIVKWKRELKSSTPYIIFQVLVVKSNEHELDEISRLANRIGVDEVKFKTAQFYDFENGNPLMPSNTRYSRYRKLSNGKYEIKNELDNQCWRMWSGPVITWDGKVVPCCFDKDAAHQLGNLNKSGLRQIWESAAYNKFREAILTGRSSIDICTNCSEGTKVWED